MRFKETQDPKPTKRYKLQNEGVNIDGLHPNLIRYINTAPESFEILITSGNDGLHVDGSRHYKGNAVDIALRNPMSKARIASLKESGVSDDQLQAVGFDEFAWHISQDDGRYPLGLTLIDVNHGSAPHIDLSWGNGTQNKKDVRLDPHSKEGRELARSFTERSTKSYTPDRLTVKPQPVNNTVTINDGTYNTPQSVNNTITTNDRTINAVQNNNSFTKNPTIPPSTQSTEEQFNELLTSIEDYEVTKKQKVDEKAKKSKATNTLLTKQKEANFKRKLQEQQFLAQLLQASQIPTINVDRVA